MTTYLCGIAPMDSGWQALIMARTMAKARAAAESWVEAEARAATGRWLEALGYPCDGPVTVTLILRAGERETRWQHEIQIQAKRCRGKWAYKRHNT